MDTLLRYGAAMAWLLNAFRWGWVALAATVSLHVHAVQPDTEDAQALRATLQRLQNKLAQSTFARPLQMDSAETPDGLRGDIHALIDRSLADVTAALKTPANWCEMLSLHINNRRCRVTRSASQGDVITLSVVRRYDLPLDSAFELPFVYRVTRSTAEMLKVDLSAATGPLGTRNYSVTLEALALEPHKTLLHFKYSYDHNTMANLATQAYLATFGSHKVGFTVIGRKEGGEPDLIRGLRGLVERNAMRYFLALDAYIATFGTTTSPDARELAWFQATERYPRQLHEVDQGTYLALKREDRQRNAP
jgi:hypothetical protein